MRDRPKVGEILVNAGIIDEDQLAEALGEQTRWGRRLGMTLIKLGMVQEGHLVRALARQFDLPVASLAGKKIAPEVIALVPAKVACEHSVIPLFVKQEGRTEQLFLGMEEPSDLGVLDDLAFRTGMAIRPVMVGPSEIGDAIDRYYNAKAPAAAPKLPDPEQLADTLSETNLRRVKEEVAPSLSQLLKAGPMATPAAPATAVSPPSANAQAPRAVEPRAAEPLAAPSVGAPPAARRVESSPAAERRLPSLIPVATAPAPDDETTSPVLPPLASNAVPTPAIVTPPPVPAAAASPVATPSPSAAASPVAVPAPFPVPSTPAAPAVAPRSGFEDSVTRALEESERTRLVAKAIAHLLIEKGLLSLEELQARIEKMKPPKPGSSM